MKNIKLAYKILRYHLPFNFHIHWINPIIIIMKYDESI